MLSEPITNRDNSLSITNSSGEDLIVLSSYDESLETSSHTPFENSLAALKTVKNKTVISDQETGVFHLDGILTSKGEKIPSRIYDLLFVKPKSFFPIANHAVMENDDDDDDPAYDPITITGREKEQMLLARKFCMHIFASPTSKLTVGFIKALNSNSLTEKPESLNQIDTKLDNFAAINAFLQSTKSYKTLDFFAISTELSFLKSYLGPWTGNKETSTFYLYTHDSSSKGLKMPTLVGTVTFTKLKFSTQVFELKNGYKSIFIDEKTKKNIPLEFDQGVLRANEQGMSIVLTPYFMKKSKWTNKSTDKVIMVAIVGKINQQDVLGSEIKLDIKKTPYDPGSFAAFIHPTTFSGHFSLAMGVAGVVFTVHFVAGLAISAYKFLKGQFGAKVPEPMERLHEKFEEMFDKMQELTSRQEVGYIDLRDVDATTNDMKAEEIALNQKEVLVNDIKSCKVMKASLKNIVKLKGADRNIENIAEELHEIEGGLEQTLQERIENLESRLEEMSKQIKSLQNLITQQQNELKHRMTEDEIEQTKEVEERFEEFDEAREEIKQNMEDVNEGEGTSEREVEVSEDFEGLEPLLEFGL